MLYERYKYNEVKVEVATYLPNDNTTKEQHLMFHVCNRQSNYEEQLNQVIGTFIEHVSNRHAKITPVFLRFFLSDASNQQSLLIEKLKEYSIEKNTAVSVVQQPLLDGTKIALWAYCIEGATTERIDNNTIVFNHESCKHLFSTAMVSNQATSEEQTKDILNNYINVLQEQGITLTDNCIRTWFFVRDVDYNYKGVVKGRNDVFDKEGLTDDTHFIASTGICGRGWTSEQITLFDAYAIKGISDEQIHHLYATPYMNRTSEYGVRFERGTYVDYADRRHIFISGTASINNKGEVVAIGNILSQTERMLTNVEALLNEASSTMSDMGVLIIYIRDIADYETVKNIFNTRYPDIPNIIVHAPVCRPEWLIEMECMGTIEINNPKLKIF